MLCCIEPPHMKNKFFISPFNFVNGFINYSHTPIIKSSRSDLWQTVSLFHFYITEGRLHWWGGGGGSVIPKKKGFWWLWAIWGWQLFFLQKERYVALTPPPSTHTHIQMKDDIWLIITFPSILLMVSTIINYTPSPFS